MCHVARRAASSRSCHSERRSHGRLRPCEGLVNDPSRSFRVFAPAKFAAVHRAADASRTQLRVSRQSWPAEGFGAAERAIERSRRPRMRERPSACTPRGILAADRRETRPAGRQVLALLRSFPDARATRFQADDFTRGRHGTRPYSGARADRLGGSDPRVRHPL